jgi:hypothetical protein
VKGAYSYGEAKNTVDPGSIALGSWTSNSIAGDPNNPALGFSGSSPGHRFFIQGSYTKNWAKWGATTVTAYFQAANSGNTSYIFSADANGDTATNDLIYIPRNQSEMNFTPLVLTASGSLPAKTFSAAEQAAAFDAYISQDKYLSQHRGEYAQRGALFYPVVKRIDLSLMQDVFVGTKGMRHAGQIRLDILNFGNLLNHNWGQGYSTYQSRILTTPAADATGALSYKMNYITTATDRILVPQTFQRSAGSSDVYVMMLSFRYSF